MTKLKNNELIVRGWEKMSKVLIVYSTNSGSTGEVADAVAEELKQNGHTVEVKKIQDAANIDGYDAVVVGAPMIFGWHQTARSFIHKYQSALAQKKGSIFCMLHEINGSSR